MGAYVKKNEYTWSPIKKIYVKVNPTGSSAWKLVQRIYTKINTSGWVLFWPKIGPYATYVPSFSTDSGNVYPVTNNIAKGSDTVFYRKIGQSLYGQNAVWNANNYTISGYSWQLKGWTAYNGGTVTDTFATGTTFPKSISLSTSGFDGWTTISQWAGKFLTFSVTANTTTTGVIGSSASDDFLSGLGYTPTKLAIVQNSPSPKGGSTSGTAGIKLGDTIYYYGTWDGREAYCPDYTKSSISLYKSTTDFGSNFTLASLINGGATLVKTELAYAGLTTFSGDGSTFNAGTSYTTTTGDENCYFYFVDAQQNSADFLNNSPVYQYAQSNQILTPPQVVVAPTISCTTPSGYGGNQNSFTVGGSVTLNTGQWTPTPNGTYAVSWLGLWGTSSSVSLTNGYQTNFNQMYLYNQYGYYYYKEGQFDTSQNQNHSFTLPSYFYTSTAGAGQSSSINKYITMETITKNGTGPSSVAYYNTPIKVHDVPYASTVSLTSTGQNAASVTFQSTGSYYYQLQYSADGSTNWTDIGSLKYISTLNIIGYTVSYTGLPNGLNYYRVMSYNDDGVTISGNSTSFNSTPPPANVSFYYYPSTTYNSKSTYGTPTSIAAVHVSGDSTTSSISYNIYRATSGTGIDGYGNYNSYVFYDSGTFTSNNGYAGGYYWFPENGYYFMEATPSNSNGAGTTTTSNSYGIYGTARDWGYCGTPADPSSSSSVSSATNSLTCYWNLPTNINTDSSASITNNVHGTSASYEIWWQGVPNTTSVPTSTSTPDFTGISPTSTSYTNTGLGGGVTRYYFIRSRNANSSGSTNVGNWVYLGGGTTLLSSQTTPTLGSYTSTSGGFTIPITNYDSAATYTATIGSYNSSTTPTASVSGSTVTVSNMSSGSYSYVSVTASKSGYYDATSSSAYGYALSNLTPPTPSSVTKSGSNFLVSFTGGSGPYYQVWWVGVSGIPTTSSYDAYGSSSPITVTDLISPSAGTTYYFSVRSVATLTTTGTGPSGTVSAWSSTQVTYYAPIVPTISMSSNTGVSQAQATINWTSTNQSSAYVDGTYVGNVTSKTITGLQPNTFYSGTVTVYSTDGTSASATYSFTTSANVTYTITFNGNGNTGGSTSSQTGNGSVTLNSNGFTRTNCSFSGWATSSGGAVSYSNGASYNLTANVTLYAVWTANSNSATAPTGFLFAGNNKPSTGRKQWTWTGVGTVTGGTATGIDVQISSTSSTSGFSTASGSPLATTARSYDIAVSPVTSSRWVKIAMVYTDGLGNSHIGTYTSAL